ncbi:hypothetical protein MYA_5539 [Burkholderia sp. KJ006]|nr:hypothetical protein MYA_5539 [Burkholderia sp. KJ006]
MPASLAGQCDGATRTARFACNRPPSCGPNNMLDSSVSCRHARGLL